MRKTFLTFCMAAFALLAVSSCGKLEDGLNKLKGEVADLTERVEKLEADLNKEVTAINETLGALKTKDQELASSINNLKDLLDEKEETISDAIQTINATLAGLDSKYVGKSTYEAALQEIQTEKSVLKTQLENLAKLLGNTDVAAMKTELLAKIAEVASSVAVTKVEKNEDGTYTLTFGNKETLTVAAADANANNTGLVTVVDGEWHVVKEDGTTESINVPLGVEDLQFSVDWETNELLYSVNGEDPVGTGAYVSDREGCVVTDFWAPEDEDFVYLYIGGVEYALVKAVENTSVLAVKSGKAYFGYAETQTFDLNKVDLSEVYVMSKPDGWKASLEGKTLTVTSPAEGNAYAETEGLVLLHGCDADGKCRVAQLEVAVGAGIKLILDKAAGTIQLYNPVVVETMVQDFETWETYFVNDFTTVQLGIIDAEFFEKSPEEAIEYGFQTNWSWVATWVIEEPIPTYDAVTCPVYTSSPVSIATLYEGLCYMPMPEGGSVVVMARTYNVTMDPMTGQQVEEFGDLVYVYYEPIYTNLVVEETTTSEIQMSAVYKNADSFLIGKYEVGNWDWEEELFYMNQGYTKWDDLDGKVTPAGQYEGSLSHFGLDEYDEADVLKPGTEYVVYMIPDTGKPYADLTFEDDINPYLDTLKTAPLTALPEGEADALAVVFTNLGATLSELNVELTAPDAAAMMYYGFYASSPDMSAEELVQDLINNGYPVVGNTATAVCRNLSQGTTRTLVAIAVDEEGNYGVFTEEDFTTAKIVYNEDIVVTFVEKSENDENGEYTVTLAVEGAEKIAVKGAYNDKVANDSWFPKNVFNYGTRTDMNTQYEWTDVVEGKATVTFPDYYNYTHVWAIAYNVDGTLVKDISNPVAFAYPVVEETPEDELQ